MEGARVSADAGAVRFERRGATAVITFDRPSARNAMTWAMYEQLEQRAGSCRRPSRTCASRCCAALAGTSLPERTSRSSSTSESGDDGVAYERRLEAVIAKLESMRVATIAAVEGYAVGGGLAIATACDLRICTPDARFGVPIAKTVGNCLSMANYARLVASLGAARTKALLFTADFMPADEARAIGFVAAVVEPEAFDAAGRCAVRARRGARADHAPGDEGGHSPHRRVGRSADGDDLVQRAYGSSDFHEGVAAFVEKRSPRWEGR